MNTPNIISILLQFSFGWVGIAATIVGTMLITGFFSYYHFFQKIHPEMMEKWISENSQLRTENKALKVIAENFSSVDNLDPIALKKAIEELDKFKDPNYQQIISGFRENFIRSLSIALRVKLKELPIEPSSYEKLKDFDSELFSSYNFNLRLNNEERKIIEDICKAKINSFGKIKSLDNFRNEKRNGFLGEIVGSDSMWDFNLNKMAQLRKEEEECIAEK